MLELSNVTICAIDTRTPALALTALERSMRDISYATAILFLNDRSGLEERAERSGIRLIGIPTIASKEAYSNFILRELSAWIETDFVLVIQWDGFVVNAASWTDAFFDNDYIGSLWHNFEGQRAVGNGGFSLRSRRLLVAMQDDSMTISHPEDVCICHCNRARLESKHGIRFATPELAARFAYERVPSSTATFGFHGAYNLPDVLTPVEMLAMTREMPFELACTMDLRELAEVLVSRRQYEAANELLGKHLRTRNRLARTLYQWTRMQFRQRLTGRA